jgi:hypothetical protein
MIVRSLEDQRRHPEDGLYFRRCRKSCLVVAREDASLQLPYPVNVTRLAFETALELLLVEPGVVEAAEEWRQAAERPDQLELPRDQVDDCAKPSLARQVQASLSIALHLGKRIAAGEKVAKEVVAAQNGVGEVACLLRRFKDALRKWAAGLNVPR